MNLYLFLYYYYYMDIGSIYNELGKEIDTLKKENNKLKKELEFYKTPFKIHRNSLISNLYIKKKKNKNEFIWYDRVRDSNDILNELEEDEDVIEWLKPVKCER